MNTNFTPEQIKEMQMLQSYFPYRIIYAAFDQNNKFSCGAVFDKRIPNKLAKKGFKVFIQKK